MDEELFDKKFLDNLSKPLSRYKACGDTYKQKENLKSWGWFWNPQRKHWEIEASPESSEIKALAKYGLTCEEIK